MCVQEYKTRSLKAVVQQLRWFAGTQIRNVASVGGNIGTASPISDLNPVWVAAVCAISLSLSLSLSLSPRSSTRLAFIRAIS